MVLGAIGYNWKSSLVFIEGSGSRSGFTSYDYLAQVLEPMVAPLFNGDPEIGDGFILHAESQ
jgi:hypothetical protein